MRCLPPSFALCEAHKQGRAGNTKKEEKKRRKTTLMAREEQEKLYVRTDLACERKRADVSLPGIFYKEENLGEIKKSILRVESEEGARSIGRVQGNYISLHFKPLWQQGEDELRALSDALSSVLLEMIPRKGHPALLVAGLGNRYLTVDAVGPQALARIVATAHLAELEKEVFASLSCHKITALAPGVLSQTGIESAHLIAGAIKESAPDFLIAIDAFAARDCERLATTLQISDTGILPGAGVGNPRTALDKESLGIPVIVIGVPTVVDSATMLYDALSRSGEEDLSEEMIALIEKKRGYFIAPRECDAVTENAARVIADAINRTYGIA